MGNKTKKLYKSAKKVAIQTNQKNRDEVKAIIECLLDLNIKYKDFAMNNVNLTADEKKMCEESIQHSRKGMINLQKVQNVETLNQLLNQCLNTNDNDKHFSMILGIASGLASNDGMLELDATITEQRANIEEALKNYPTGE